MLLFYVISVKLACKGMYFIPKAQLFVGVFSEKTLTLQPKRVDLPTETQ
jgi:hypothetical protein